MPQPLVVVSKPGGSSTVGSNYVRDARNDGYTVLCLHEAIMTAKITGAHYTAPPLQKLLCVLSPSVLTGSQDASRDY